MRIFLVLLASLLWAAPSIAAPKRIIASVMPVHSIVSAVMGDVGQPDLLLQGKMSEHRASFTPLQVARLADADLVFIVGHGLEAKLAQLSGTETVNGKHFVELADAPGIMTLPVREGGAWEAHHHEDGDVADGQSHDHDAAEGILTFDPHVWLDPRNAKAMAEAVAAALAASDPDNAATYAANAKAFAAAVDQTTTDIEAKLAPVKDKPFIVFHDAFQYFEARFGLAGVGSISDVSALAPSAERLKTVRDRIAQADAVCVFREPQYDSKVVDTVIEGTGTRSGILDPIGADLSPGPSAYSELLRNLTTELASCLNG